MRHRAGFYEKYVKRFFDFFLSGMALIILSPLLLVTAILVRVKLGSPVIFCQERPGKGRADLQAPQIPQHERRAG